MKSFSDIEQKAREQIAESQSLEDLDALYRAYLGRKGELTLKFKELAGISGGERKEVGARLNDARDKLEDLFRLRAEEIRGAYQGRKIEEEWIDITAPGRKHARGHLHPLTLVGQEIENIFSSLGFSVIEGPEIEDEWHNFDALNIPPEHPARDMWDTFWLKPESQNSRLAAEQAKLKSHKPLLRTHTSPVQIRYMKEHKPPFRIIAPGRTFRHEATDVSHNFEFYQVEGLMVGKDVSVANFRAVFEAFLQKLFNKDVRIRLRPSFFPFVEPGFEVDMSCVACSAKGCSVCKQSGWLEIMGAGMVHRNVFSAVGYNPDDWQGFAFGLGMDRVAMMKYNIGDIRLLYESDIRFLEQF